jgi:hypothetical protein
MDVYKCKKSKEKAQKGVALVAVLILAGIFTILGLAFYSLAAYEAGLYERRWELTQAFCKAESGVERARWVLVKTQSKSKALIDSSGINVYEVVELEHSYAAAAGSSAIVRQSEDLIDFQHPVRVRSRGIERGQEREIMVVFKPGLKYAVATAQHITFHGGSNDWSAADAIDPVNDVYIQGGLLYDHHINLPNWPFKYDWYRPDTVNIPPWLKTVPAFRNRFLGLEDTVFVGDQSWGWNPDDSTWSELPNNSIVYVRGSVDIGENVRQNWQTESVDVTILATNKITVLNGKNDNDDRLVLIAVNNVIFEGDDPDNSLNAFCAAGNKVVTTNPGGGGVQGGEGGVHGMIWVCYDIDMRGYDPEEIYPYRRGWKITQRIETMLLNGGLSILPWLSWAPLLELHPETWTEVVPGG